MARASKFQRVIAVDDKLHVHRSPTGSRTTATRRSSLRPYALILRRGKPDVAGYAVLHEGFVGVIGDSSVQEITYANIEKETGRVRDLKGDGGWLGFTDKYWASAIIPDQSEPIEARFSVERRGAAGRLPDRLHRPGADGRARRVQRGATAHFRRRQGSRDDRRL